MGVIIKGLLIVVFVTMHLDQAMSARSRRSYSRSSYGSSYSDSSVDVDGFIDGSGLTDTQLYIIIGVASGIVGLLIIICIVCVCCCGKTCKEMCECYCFCIKGAKKLYTMCTGEECGGEEEGDGGEGGGCFGGGEGEEGGGCLECISGLFEEE